MTAGYPLTHQIWHDYPKLNKEIHTLKKIKIIINSGLYMWAQNDYPYMHNLLFFFQWSPKSQMSYSYVSIILLYVCRPDKLNPGATSGVF